MFGIAVAFGGMGFLDDIWTALLSDDQAEVGEVLERISEDETATAVARSALLSVEPADAGDALEDPPLEPDLSRGHVAQWAPG